MLDNLLLTAVANPGAYVPVEPSLWSVLLLVALVVAGAVLPFLATDLTGDIEVSAPRWSLFVGAVLFLAGISGIIFLATAPTGSDEYQEQVAHWLDVDYGITVDADGVTDLQNGGDIVAVVDGRRTVVTMISGADGILDLIAADGTVVEPLR